MSQLIIYQAGISKFANSAFLLFSKLIIKIVIIVLVNLVLPEGGSYAVGIPSYMHLSFLTV